MIIDPDKTILCHITAMGDQFNETPQQERMREIRRDEGVEEYYESLVNGDVLNGYSSRAKYTFNDAIEELLCDTSACNALRHLLLANTGEQAAKATYLLKNLLRIHVLKEAESLYDHHNEE
ncbi:MAG: hypothetical protein ACPG3T_03135 [Pseudomonadales bacterium]